MMLMLTFLLVMSMLHHRKRIKGYYTLRVMLDLLHVIKDLKLR